MIFPFVLALLLVSLAGNGYQLYRAKRPRIDTNYDARQLLADMCSGVALVKITRIAPEDVLLRTSRGGL